MNRRMNESYIAQQKQNVSTVINVLISACVVALLTLVVVHAQS